MLSVVNKELGGNFELNRFSHVARFNHEQEWMEMFVRSQCDQIVRVADLELEVEFAVGELMRTEISAKFRREALEAELRAAGFNVRYFWTDRDGDFSLSLSFSTNF